MFDNSIVLNILYYNVRDSTNIMNLCERIADTMIMLVKEGIDN